MDPVAWLDRRYPSRTAARALWRWSGADPAPVEGPGEGPTWPRLWPLAVAHDGGVSLMREALFDHPGDPDLVDWIARLAERECLSVLEQAPAVASRFEAIRAELTPAGVRGVLRALPATTTREAFAAMVPVCEPWLTRPERERLAEVCTLIAERDAALAEVLALRQKALTWPEARSTVARLHRHAEAAQDAWGGVLRELSLGSPIDATPARLALGAEVLLRSPEGEAACGTPARVAALAEGLRDALWGTHADYDDEGEAG